LSRNAGRPRHRARLAGAIPRPVFHALRPRQLRSLHLTDLRDGRLHLDSHVVPLARQARARLAAYLDYRARRWPNTANPHVFINDKTANHTTETIYKWINKVFGLRAQTVREDRILNGVRATAGDVRRVCDLFGLSIDAALRYTDTLDDSTMADTE
jgi:hypothetical protein